MSSAPLAASAPSAIGPTARMAQRRQAASTGRDWVERGCGTPRASWIRTRRTRCAGEAPQRLHEPAKYNPSMASVTASSRATRSGSTATTTSAVPSGVVSTSGPNSASKSTPTRR